jgi:hypothetical protein
MLGNGDSDCNCERVTATQFASGPVLPLGLVFSPRRARP